MIVNSDYNNDLTNDEHIMVNIFVTQVINIVNHMKEQSCVKLRLMLYLWLLDEHDSPQWYDIVHFEHKLSWLCFVLSKRPHPIELVFLTYKPMIIP